MKRNQVGGTHKKLTQADAVAIAMRNNGGFSTLGGLVSLALSVPGVKWATKTPDASIRQIVQLDPRFFRIKPGLWALEEFKDRISFLKDASAPPTSKEQSDFSHGYYQGLLAEIGTMRRMRTFIPAPDRNRKFLDKTLSQVVTLDKLPDFSYDWILKRAKNVDVVWLNERDMPAFFMEVEHSTDIQNSLLKFYDLQDFHSEFRIVAPQNRHREFTAKLDKHAFREIKHRVKFASYEDIERMHTAEGTRYALSDLL
jgi:hypothetical protein